FTSTAGHIYKVSCTSSSSYLCYLNVRDAGGTSVASSTYGTSTSATFRATAAASFNIDVYAYSTYTGSYSVTVTDLGADDHGDTAATATALTLGGATPANEQCAYDQDFLSFTATAASICTVSDHACT